MRRALPAIAVSVTLLAAWPASQSAFHDPKRWVLVVAALIGALISLPKWRWTALPLIALTAVQTWHGAEAGLQAMAFAWALASWQADLRQFTRLVGAAAAVVGVVVLLQALGVDALGFATPEVGDGRLSVYGTLGNPDFVASMLLPIAILLLPSRHPRPVEGLLGLLIIIPALIVTRSFATVLSAMVAGVVVSIHRHALSPTLSPSGRGRSWRSLRKPILAMCGLIALLGVGLIGRDLGQTIAGRGYLVSVALPHVTDAPLLGHGLGSTVLAWPTWELSFWQARCPDAACVSADPRHVFAALQDHVHADWLEWMLERGLLGFFALLLALSAPLLAAWKSEDSLLLAAMSALLARSLVDFPLHRPADLCLLAALAACATSSRA
ncbi:MAG: hypothetical protein Q8N23_06515 [Archangium sp.]|nr:hypothetical protein [Archangium sp.]MDP3152305.1 hypothetical protein [Archangium sp.]